VIIERAGLKLDGISAYYDCILESGLAFNATSIFVLRELSSEWKLVTPVRRSKRRKIHLDPAARASAGRKHAAAGMETGRLILARSISPIW
jgi:hypothetical protein